MALHWTAAGMMEITKGKQLQILRFALAARQAKQEINLNSRPKAAIVRSNGDAWPKIFQQTAGHPHWG